MKNLSVILRNALMAATFLASTGFGVSQVSAAVATPAKQACGYEDVCVICDNGGVLVRKHLCNCC
ncbi:hypothetical protein KWH19_20815 [Xanthomonas campestris pv. pennamericanum]|uniref:hypothetical protein n=1 Tax=Xanthomonas euvesicatoria TaxID=456327 RepID=UPI001C44D466|nr:hypothetical protein [Xanthomonas euvesicatoria]MBV6812121.1 hypothetical protein [Xanthomonas campestris pv. pennamericanum]